MSTLGCESKIVIQVSYNFIYDVESEACRYLPQIKGQNVNDFLRLKIHKRVKDNLHSQWISMTRIGNEIW